MRAARYFSVYLGSLTDLALWEKACHLCHLGGPQRASCSHPVMFRKEALMVSHLLQEFVVSFSIYSFLISYPLMSYTIGSMEFILKVYLFQRLGDRGEMQRYLRSTNLLPRWLQWPGLSQAEVKSPELWGLACEWPGPTYLCHFLLLSQEH